MAHECQRDGLVKLLHRLSGRIVKLLERLCRSITRPPIATKRRLLDERDRVVYRYSWPFRDGLTHVLLAISLLRSWQPFPEIEWIWTPISGKGCGTSLILWPVQFWS